MPAKTITCRDSAKAHTAAYSRDSRRGGLLHTGTNHRTTPPIHQWADTVRGQLDTELAGLKDVTLVALAGEQYRTALLHSTWPYEVPMKGLGIGQQLGWLTARLNDERAVAAS